MPPSQAELEALAERALTFLDGEGQATAWWEFRARRTESAVELTEHTYVDLGGVATDRTDDEGLRDAAVAVSVLGLEPPLTEPEPGRSHDGYDPRAIVSAERAARALPYNGQWQTSAAKTAIASTRGVRAYEQRSFAALHLLGLGPRELWVSVAATGPDDLDPDAIRRDVLEFAGEEQGTDTVAPGEYPVVLGPWAVAWLLNRAAWRFSTLAAETMRPKLGTRVAASAINLSNSPRFARTLPRSYDAAGAPIKPSPLIQDGVAHRHIEHRPGNLVLVGGGAASVAELAKPIQDGLVITSFRPNDRGVGVRRIIGGELAGPVADVEIEADAFDVLASTEALTARQWLVPALGYDSARTISAVVAPGLRARMTVR